MIFKRVVYLWLGLLLMTGCSLQLVSAYDPVTVNQVGLIEKKIDFLYKKAEITPLKNREYQYFAEQYLSIDVEIRAFVRRQQRRDNNLETTQQAEILANLWEQDRLAHQQTNTVSDFIIKRRTNQYQRIFTALFDGENAKKID